MQEGGLLRGGVAKDGAGHQGECGRHHQIRSTSQMNHLAQGITRTINQKFEFMSLPAQSILHQARILQDELVVKQNDSNQIVKYGLI